MPPWAPAHAGDPRVRRPVDPAAVVLLRVLAEVPDVAVVVLGLERELALEQPAGVDVALPDHDRAHAVDDLREVRDRRDDPVRAPSLAAVRAPFEDVLGARDQRRPPVVDARRVGEVARVEVPLGGLPRRGGAARGPRSRRAPSAWAPRRPSTPQAATPAPGTRTATTTSAAGRTHPRDRMSLPPEASVTLSDTVSEKRPETGCLGVS